MKKLNKQLGFGAVEVVLLFVVVGIIIFGGWYVWQANNNANKSLENANQAGQTGTNQPAPSDEEEPGDKTISLKSNNKALVTFQIPNGWTRYSEAFPKGGASTSTSALDSKPCSVSATIVEKALSCESVLPKSLISQARTKNSSMLLSARVIERPSGKSLPQILSEDFLASKLGTSGYSYYAQKSLTINGYDAYQYDYAAGQDYRDVHYLVVNDEYAVLFSARVTSGQTNNTRYLSAIKSILDTVSFPSN